MTQPPVILMIFNRPDETARTFAAIRAARPERLLVIADGPRAGQAGEAELCARTRSIIDGVDWPCEVLRDFSEANLGCGRRVASGLDWAFELVEEAIIFEDDCVADSSFFRYCAELLERYRSDECVMMISGDNFQNGISRTGDSYYFSRLPHCWGWATWRRAWRHFDYTMRDWPQQRRTRWLRTIAKDPALERCWRQQFDGVASGKIDTWDFQWMYCVLSRNGLSIVPDVNLVTNIGFGERATHTFAADERHVVPSRSMTFPLRHPAVVAPCEAADEFEKRYLYRLFRLPLFGIIYPELLTLLELARPWLERTGLWAGLRTLASRLRS
jgi:hypothetical protein